MNLRQNLFNSLFGIVITVLLLFTACTAKDNEMSKNDPVESNIKSYTHTWDEIMNKGEPPLYAQPVAISIADAQIKAGKYIAAIETYQSLLKRFPKSA